jgi:hypothetical protein
MFKKSFVVLILLTLFSFPALAQESDIDQTVIEGEELEVAAADLEVTEPGPFSWFQNIIRDIQILITRDPVKKSELLLKKASRQLIRLRKIVSENPDDPRLQAKFEKIDEKYQGLIEKINNRIGEFQAENPEAPGLNSFLDKYNEHQLRHQEILERLGEQVPEEVMEIIETNRLRHLEKFGEVMNRLQNREEFKEGLGEILEDVGERIEHRVRQMEIIEELEEITGTEIKEVIGELKQERQELFQELKLRRQEIRDNLQQIRQNIRE